VNPFFSYFNNCEESNIINHSSATLLIAKKAMLILNQLKKRYTLKEEESNVDIKPIE
jgi:hypothetical protein